MHLSSTCRPVSFSMEETTLTGRNITSLEACLRYRISRTRLLIFTRLAICQIEHSCREEPWLYYLLSCGILKNQNTHRLKWHSMTQCSYMISKCNNWFSKHWITHCTGTTCRLFTQEDCQSIHQKSPKFLHPGSTSETHISYSSCKWMAPMSKRKKKKSYINECVS